MKLQLKSEISSHTIGVGEFLVAVPFVKKDRQDKPRVGASETAPEDSNINEKLRNDSESVWSDLMQDLSSSRDTTNHENLTEAELKSKNSGNEDASKRRTSSCTKRERNAINEGKGRPSCDALLSILQTSGDGMLVEQSLKEILQYIDSSSCLSEPATGSCVMREAGTLVSCKLDPCKSNLCLCPLWLKDVIRTFSFVNIYSAYLQLSHKQITIAAVREPLQQLHKFGFRPDLELLNQICPEVSLVLAPTVLLRSCLPQTEHLRSFFNGILFFSSVIF